MLFCRVLPPGFIQNSTHHPCVVSRLLFRRFVKPCNSTEATMKIKRSCICARRGGKNIPSEGCITWLQGYCFNKSLLCSDLKIYLIQNKSFSLWKLLLSDSEASFHRKEDAAFRPLIEFWLYTASHYSISTSSNFLVVHISGLI